MDFNQTNPVEMYRREVAEVQPLTDEELSHLFQLAAKPGEQGEEAKRRLIESTLHIVLRIADQHPSRHLSMMDLIEEGNLGLMRALDNFRGNSLEAFSTYAATHIENSIATAAAKRKRPIDGNALET
jgi:RNA polymerase primary sigma factor